MNAETMNESGGISGAHLHESVRWLLGQSDSERIDAIRSGAWVPYPRAAAVTEQLEYVLAQPTSQRMVGLTIYGPTNNGKTSLVRNFIEAHSARHHDLETECKEFIYVETPATPNPAMLFTKMLRAVGVANPEQGSANQRMARVLHILPQIRPRMIFLDEIHNVLAGSGKQSEVFLNTLKELSNELRLPMVLIGTENATNVLKTDLQVLNRFPPVELPQWEGPTFSKLASQLLLTLPLREPSPLTSSVHDRLHRMSGGVIGGLVQLLQRAACYAIQRGIERIDERVLDAIDAQRGRVSA